MVGPSARGSEKGIPNSRRSAPRAAISSARAGGGQIRVTGRNKGDQGLFAFFLELPENLVNPRTGHLQSLCHCFHVLVAPAGEVDDDNVLCAVFGRQPVQIGDGVGAFQGRQDAFGAGQEFEALQGLLVGHRHVFGPAGILEIGVLRPHPGIIQPRRQGMGFLDIAPGILQQIPEGAVEHADGPGHRVAEWWPLIRPCPAASTPTKRTGSPIKG